MKPGVILDKSFLQGVSGTRIQELAQSHQLVMCETTFYELLTGEEPGRSRCFAKLRGTNPVALVNDIGPLLRMEIDSGNPAGRPSFHRIDVPFRFNPGLVTSTYVLPAEAQATLGEMTALLESDVRSFIQRVEVVPSFFPGLLAGNDDARRNAREEAEEALVAPRALIPFYLQLELPDGKPLPTAETMTEHWALYRHLQMQMMFALDVYTRYQGQVPDIASPKVYERTEHDVLDAKMMMLACLEGAFATQEVKLKRWFRLARPDGTLFDQ